MSRVIDLHASERHIIDKGISLTVAVVKVVVLSRLWVSEKRTQVRRRWSR